MHTICLFVGAPAPNPGGLGETPRKKDIISVLIEKWSMLQSGWKWMDWLSSVIVLLLRT